MGLGNRYADYTNIGIKAGDIIVDYDRVYDVVMNWYSLGWQMQSLTGSLRQKRSLRIIRGDKFIDLTIQNK